MMFDLPRPPRANWFAFAGRYSEREPRVVQDGPVKENVLTGDDVDLLKFPVPKWNRLDVAATF